MHKNNSNKTFIYDELASNNLWDNFANKYETSRRLNIIFEELIVASELSGALLLDAGSGGGHFSQVAESLGADVVSMDVGLNLLDQVGKKCNSRKVTGSVVELPFKKENFDIVLCTEVIEHTPEPTRALQQLGAAVRPGGLLVVTVPCRLWNPVVNLATIFKLRPYEGYENFLWPGELKSTLKKNGFEIEMLFGFNFCPFFYDKIDALFVFFDKVYGKSMPWLMLNLAVRARKRNVL